MVVEFGNEVGALGAGSEEAHITLEYVPELGHFVEACFAQDAANGCDTGVVGAGPYGAGLLFGVDDHGAEFVDLEGVPPFADAFLTIEKEAGCEYAIGEPDYGNQ